MKVINCDALIKIVTKIVFDCRPCSFVVVVLVAFAFAVDAAATEFDDAISTDVAAVVFHLVVVLFVVAAGASDFENGNNYFAIACCFFRKFF